MSLPGIELGQHGAIQRQLADIGSRHFLESRGGRTIGLVVGDQDRIGDHGEAVDLAGDGKRCRP